MKNDSLLFLLTYVLVACRQPEKAAIMIEGHKRTFMYHKPVSAISGGSLLFVMHGSGGEGKNMLPKRLKLEAVAGKEKLLIVYPDGYHHY